jgi:hypothetical protein
MVINVNKIALRYFVLKIIRFNWRTLHYLNTIRDLFVDSLLFNYP